MAHDREVAGIRCQQVLERLSAFLDDELEPVTRDRIEAHLRGCDWCERFGGEFTEMVLALRSSLGEADSVSPTLVERLRARLRDE